jgi:predicted RNase H-like nuclease
MPVVGVDGCRDGWFAIRIEDDFEREAITDVYPNLCSLLDAWDDATLVLIDIPIGLPDVGRPARGADRAARNLLRPLRHNSVFSTPSRAAIELFQSVRGAEYEALSAANHREIGKRLSRQSAAIIPKIAEVDEVLLSDAAARSIVHEVHPELCYWGLNGRRPMMHRKQDTQGIAERLELLPGLLPWAVSIFERTLKRYRRASVQRDDILDAMAAAVTALPAHPLLSGLQSVPVDEERDREGLPMQMLYRLARRPGAPERERSAGLPSARTHRLFDTL